MKKGRFETAVSNLERSYIFRPVKAMPLVIWRWKMKKMTSTGMQAIRLAAMAGFMAVVP